MGDYESRQEDARRERSEDRYEARCPDTCTCGSGDFVLVDTEMYGTDTDGNRGQHTRTWECRGCGEEVVMAA